MEFQGRVHRGVGGSGDRRCGKWRGQSVGHGDKLFRPPPEARSLLAPDLLQHRIGSRFLEPRPAFRLASAEVQPFQIIFNPTSAAELSRMPKELQLQILGQFRGLPQELQREEGQYGHLTKDGRTLTRYRLGEYRIYFERHPLGIVVHRILTRHSLKDFLFRSNLGADEDASLADNPKFWDLIEQTRSTAKQATR